VVSAGGKALKLSKIAGKIGENLENGHLFPLIPSNLELSHFGGEIAGKIDKTLEKKRLFPLMSTNLMINHWGFHLF